VFTPTPTGTYVAVERVRGHFLELPRPPVETLTYVGRGLLALCLLLTGWSGCGDRVVQGLAPNPCAKNPDGAGCPPRVWPNAISKTNSDAWLREHHDTLVRIEPQVLVLEFFNPATVAEIQDLAMQQAEALAEASRYHAYADPNAPAFVQYKVWRVVDLADRTTTSSFPQGSSLVPVTAAGAFDPVPLFSQAYADRYGIKDPADPSGRNLMLCELFERGMINEVWMAVGDDPPRGPLTIERKVKYDAAGAPTGEFEGCAGGGACLNDITCKVSVRLAHLAPRRGLACDVEIRTFPLESEATWGAIPYLDVNARSFFNGDFDTRFGVSFKSWYDVCESSASPCSYPTPTSVTGTDKAGTPFTIEPFIQGCGSARFPPNARFKNDFNNAAPVASRCEHFGMRDGSGGMDTLDTYTPEKVAALTTRFGADCGGGWQVYLRQSMPGLGNKATGADGKPMKNWWPFSFY